MKLITLLALILTLSSCSFSDSNKEVVAVQNDDLEFAVDTIADQSGNDEFVVDESPIADTAMPEEIDSSPVKDISMVAPEEPAFSEFKEPDQKTEEYLTEAPAQIKIDPIPTPRTSRESTYSPGGSMATYKVQKDETLMMIAFKIYGDYHKWKDIKGWNSNITKIGEGTELSYMEPEQKFGWSPSGLPYLVRTGDTLGTVSLDKYGTPKKWKAIYENNRPLIKNPNLIFAGFTIYYQPARSLASEPN